MRKAINYRNNCLNGTAIFFDELFMLFQLYFPVYVCLFLFPLCNGGHDLDNRNGFFWPPCLKRRNKLTLAASLFQIQSFQNRLSCHFIMKSLFQFQFLYFVDCNLQSWVTLNTAGGFCKKRFINKNNKKVYSWGWENFFKNCLLYLFVLFWVKTTKKFVFEV